VLRQLSALVPVSIRHFQASPAEPPGCRGKKITCFVWLTTSTHRYPVAIQFRNPAAKPAAQSTFCGIYGLRHIYVLRHLRLLDGIWCCANKRAYWSEQFIPNSTLSRSGVDLNLTRKKTPTWSPSLIRTHRVEKTLLQLSRSIVSVSRREPTKQLQSPE